jgi:hypothetical protein
MTVRSCDSGLKKLIWKMVVKDGVEKVDFLAMVTPKNYCSLWVTAILHARYTHLRAVLGRVVDLIRWTQVDAPFEEDVPCSGENMAY